MSKLVILELEGDFQQSGFRATLEIRSDATMPILKIRGFLPPAPDLDLQLRQHWQEHYRSLGVAQYRIKAQKITYKGSINRRVATCRESAQQVRDRFFNWLNAESFQGIDRRLREELHRHELIRFLLRTDVVQVQKLPWHEWDFFEQYPNAELAFSSLDYERIVQPTPIAKSPKVRILAILGNAQGLDLERDRAKLTSLPNADVEFLVEPTRQQVNDCLWEQHWDIFFFAGHSETQNATGRIYINRTDSLSLSELKYGLRTAIAQNLQLAIFNSCDGLGLAYELQTLNLPQIIVMREPIVDQVAHAFLHYFLDAFSQGLSLYQATRQARERLQGLEDQFPCASWLPVIYQNSITVPPTWQDLFAPGASPSVDEHLVSSASQRPLANLQLIEGESSRHPLPAATQRTWRDRLLPVLKSGCVVLLVSAVVAAAVLGLRRARLLERLEFAAFDYLVRLRPSEAPDTRLLIVAVTKQDVEQLEYPIPDHTLLKALQILNAHQPRAIGVDLYRERATGSGWTALTQYLQRNDRVIPVCVHPDQTDPASGIAPPPNLPLHQVSFADATIDGDGVVRRHLLAIDPPQSSPCTASYALSTQLALRYLQAEGMALEFPRADEWQLGATRFTVLQPWSGFYQSPEFTRGHQILLTYRVYNDLNDIAKRVSLMDVLNHRVDPALIKDKVVLIGVTDPSIKDDFPTPYGTDLRGLMFHAQMVSQLLSAVQDQRPLLRFWPFWLEAGWIGIWAIAGGSLVRWGGFPLYRIIAGGGVILLLVGISVVFMVNGGIVVPLVPAAVAGVITGSVLLLHRFNRSHPPSS